MLSEDPIDPIDPVDPMLPIEAKDPTLKIDSADPCEPMLRNEFFDQRYHRLSSTAGRKLEGIPHHASRPRARLSVGAG